MQSFFTKTSVQIEGERVVDVLSKMRQNQQQTTK